MLRSINEKNFSEHYRKPLVWFDYAVIRSNQADQNHAEKDDEESHSVNRLHAFVDAFAALKYLRGEDRTDPIPMEHQVNQNSKCQGAKAAELKV